MKRFRKSNTLKSGAMVKSFRGIGRFPVLLLICLFGSATVAFGQVNAEQCITIGRNVLSMDDYMLSIQYFNQAIKAKPYLSDPYFFRGLAKLYLEDYKGAEEDCTLAIERNKFKTESYKVRGFARQYLGKDSLAIEDYKIGLATNPHDKYFLFYKAVAETELRRLEDADSTFRILLRLYPRFEDGIAARGTLRALSGDTVAALADLDEAISLAPASLNARLHRAEILSKQKKWEAAAEDMNQAITLRPQETDFYLNRAYLRYNNDDFFGAMADYNYALELQPYNSAALFNRALLRYEVKDLDRSAADFTEVLRLDPENFHAGYNLGLVDLERGKYREAIGQFNRIVQRYPRFYPAYYARAEAYHKLGDMRTALQNVNEAETLIKRYVKNPGGYKLDRPTIAAGTTNTSGHKAADGEGEESEMEVMQRFNQLVTVGASENAQMSYNEKIKGRVQDRDMLVRPEGSYTLTFEATPVTLQNSSSYFRELDEFNRQGYITGKLYLGSGDPTPTEEDKMKEAFTVAAYYQGVINDGKGRPADYLAAAVALTMLRNYEEALRLLNEVIGKDPRFTLAYMMRGYVRGAAALHSSGGGKNDGDDGLTRQLQARQIQNALGDYETALSLNPRLIYARFNQGNIYYGMKDYTSALQCYTDALRTDPDFGEALFNRGLCYLQMGNKRQAFIDLSKAGELGVIASYNLLKRMK